MKYKDIHSLAKQTEITFNGRKITLNVIHLFALKRNAHSPNNQLMTDHDAKAIQNHVAEQIKKENPKLKDLVDEYVRVTQSEL